MRKRKRVDLPLPVGPDKVYLCPFFSSRFTLWRAILVSEQLMLVFSRTTQLGLVAGGSISLTNCSLSLYIVN